MSVGYVRRRAASLLPVGPLVTVQTAATSSQQEELCLRPESRAVLTANTDAASQASSGSFFKLKLYLNFFFTFLACWWSPQVASRWMKGQMDVMPPATQRQVALTASKVERLLASLA